MVGFARETFVVRCDRFINETFAFFQVLGHSARDLRTDFSFLIEFVGVAGPTNFNNLRLDALGLYKSGFGFRVVLEFPTRELHVRLKTNAS